MDRGSGVGMATGHLRTLRVGPRALLVEVSGADEARLLADWVRGNGLHCDDVVPAARTVLLDGVDDPESARTVVARWSPTEPAGTSGELVHIPVHYDGADLERVADVWGVGVDEVVARHTTCEFISSFTGFAPGFAYLSGLPTEWSVPRLDVPRAVVPAGSVALADDWCAVYPGESPGGWLLLGRTGVTLWDLSRTAGPALLMPGTRVRFVVA